MYIHYTSKLFSIIFYLNGQCESVCIVHRTLLKYLLMADFIKKMYTWKTFAIYFSQFWGFFSCCPSTPVWIWFSYFILFFFFFFITTFFKFLWQPEKVLQLNAVLIIFQSKPFIHLGTICETEICDWSCCQANYCKITQICLDRLQFFLLLDCLFFRSNGYVHLN